MSNGCSGEQKCPLKQSHHPECFAALPSITMSWIHRLFCSHSLSLPHTHNHPTLNEKCSMPHIVWRCSNMQRTFCKICFCFPLSLSCLLSPHCQHIWSSCPIIWHPLKKNQNCMLEEALEIIWCKWIIVTAGSRLERLSISSQIAMIHKKEFSVCSIY